MKWATIIIVLSLEVQGHATDEPHYAPRLPHSTVRISRVVSSASRRAAAVRSVQNHATHPAAHTQARQTRRQVIKLSASWCGPCRKADEAIDYLIEVNPLWTTGKSENSHFRVLDIESDTEGQNLARKWKPKYLPAWIISDDQGNETLRTGWTHQPRSQEAIDELVGMFGYVPADYREVQ